MGASPRNQPLGRIKLLRLPRLSLVGLYLRGSRTPTSARASPRPPRRLRSSGNRGEGVSALERSGELLQYYGGVGHQGLEELLRRPDVVGGGPTVRWGRAFLPVSFGVLRRHLNLHHHLLTEEFGAADHRRSSRSIGSSAKRSVHSLTGGGGRLARQVSPGEMQWPKRLAAFWWTPLLEHRSLPEQVPTA